MKRVLIVEDEEAIRSFEVVNLQRSGYTVVDVTDGESALRVYNSSGGNFDVVILDITLPGMDGFEVCKRLRSQSAALGILFLTARTQEMDKVGGLMMGADDYITKPFSPSELVARVDAVYRRVQLASSPEIKTIIESGPFILNTKSRSLLKNGHPVELTQVEFQIVELLMQHHGDAMERTRILAEVWGTEVYTDAKIVDVNIRRLRVKIEDEPSKPTYIQTVWGYGYKWCP